MSGRVIGDKYVLLRQLAAGGMAEVFLARQMGLRGFQKLVVIKRMLPQLLEDPDFVEMFLDEARTVADLRHPNVVSVFEVAEFENTFYLAMEFLHGVNVAQVMRVIREPEGSGLPRQHALQIGIDAARGLHYAHTKASIEGSPMRIVHRDVSPHNVLVTFNGQTKIVDFGIATARNRSRQTDPGVVRGKVAYMSPEQVRGLAVDARSDQFSLAVVICELVLGRHLFSRESDVALARAVAEADIVRPSQVDPDFPGDLERILLHALNRDPRDRYADCGELADALEYWMDSNGVQHSTGRVGLQLQDLFNETQRNAILDPDTWNLLGHEPQPAPDGSKELTLSTTVHSATAPDGRIALAMAAVEDAGRLWERAPDSMDAGLRVYREVLRKNLHAEGGYEVRASGDRYEAAFASIVQATRWALGVQRDLIQAPWPEAVLHLTGEDVATAGHPLRRGLRVRMAICHGEVDGEVDPITGRVAYTGTVVDRARELSGMARGGQLLLDDAAWEGVQGSLSELEHPATEDLGRVLLVGGPPAPVWQLLPRELEARTFLPLRGDPTPPSGTNLLPTPTSFVGRADELEEIARRFGAGERLITIMGPPGTGKTRLAKRYGEVNYRGDGGGVWFVDLTEAITPDGVLFAIAQSLGLQLASRSVEELAARVGEAIAARGRVLVILDGFDAVIDLAPATLGAVIPLAPDAHFLVTSRSRLSVVGERLFELQPLPVPTADAPGEPSEAVQLFVQRAQAVLPGFQLDQSNRRVLGEIARRLDGIPLAIELAAARLRVLSPPGILSRIEQRFELLADTSREPRQATLHGAIDWSWTMLTDLERSALAQCSAFRGGFSLEAAEAVFDLSKFPDAPWTPDVVQSLCDKSLLQRKMVDRLQGEFRFSMLESIRAFVRDKLSEIELEVLRHRHAAYFQQKGVRLLTELDLRGGLDPLKRLEHDIENLVLSYRRQLRNPSGEGATRALQMLLCIEPVLIMRGPLSLLIRLLDQGLEHPGIGSVDPELRADVRRARGRAREGIGDVAAAQADLEAAAALASKSGAFRLEARILDNLAVVLHNQGSDERAHEMHVRSLALAESCQDKRMEAQCREQLGFFHLRRGELTDAFHHLQHALTIYRELGDQLGEAYVLLALGSFYLTTGDEEQAERCYQRSLEAAEDVKDQRLATTAVANLGLIDLERRRYDAAAEKLTRAKRQDLLMGDRGAAVDMGYLGAVYHEAGRLADARREYEAGVDMLERLGPAYYDVVFTACLGALEAETGNLSKSARRFERAHAKADKLGLDLAETIVVALEGILECARSEDAARSGDVRGSSRLRQDLKQRIERAQDEGQRSDDVRLAVRLLERAMARGG